MANAANVGTAPAPVPCKTGAATRTAFDGDIAATTAPVANRIRPVVSTGPLGEAASRRRAGGNVANVLRAVDPVSGDNAIYLRAPIRNGGLSPTWMQEQLVDLLRDGTPN